MGNRAIVCAGIAESLEFSGLVGKKNIGNTYLDSNCFLLIEGFETVQIEHGQGFKVWTGLY
jgi:hypothetical protein